jgi:hypothetical protein
LLAPLLIASCSGSSAHDLDDLCPFAGRSLHDVEQAKELAVQVRAQFTTHASFPDDQRSHRISEAAGKLMLYANQVVPPLPPYDDGGLGAARTAQAELRSACG